MEVQQMPKVAPPFAVVTGASSNFKSSRNKLQEAMESLVAVLSARAGVLFLG